MKAKMSPHPGSFERLRRLAVAHLHSVHRKKERACLDQAFDLFIEEDAVQTLAGPIHALMAKGL